MTRTVTRPAITQAMQLALWKRWGYVKCQVCFVKLSPGQFQWDHHLSLVDKGKHDVENIRPICKGCHKVKSAHEHRENARAKRRAKRHTNPLPPSRMTHPKLKRKMDGTVVPRAPNHPGASR